jgi:uncharacterized protein YidB (DUF937 family)
MDLNTILQLGVSAIQNNSDEATTGLDGDLLSGALSKLVGEGDSLDLGSLVSSLNAGGLADIAASWLGDGDNAAISPDAIAGLLGDEKVSAFASELGLSGESAKQAIADALPQMMDNASSGGSLAANLLDQVGGVSGLMGLASRFFGKS